MTREDWLALGQVVDFHGAPIMWADASGIARISLYPPIRYDPLRPEYNSVPTGSVYIIMELGLRPCVNKPVAWRVYRNLHDALPLNVLEHRGFGALAGGVGQGGVPVNDTHDGMVAPNTWLVFKGEDQPVLWGSFGAQGAYQIDLRVLAVQLPADLYEAILAELDPRKRKRFASYGAKTTR